MRLGPKKNLLFDWGDTLMSENGPQDITMADWKHVQAIDGALETVAALATRYKLGIASNATISKRPDIRRALQRTKLSPFFGDIFCYTEIGFRKDNPQFWRVVLDRLAAHAADVVMIGDSWKQDVRGPRDAGIDAIWFNWKSEPVPDETNIVIRRLDELLPLFLAGP